ncbi:MAG: hypothetical protein V1792_03395 [Pseudomonadota bacterium]
MLRVWGRGTGTPSPSLEREHGVRNLEIAVNGCRELRMVYVELPELPGRPRVTSLLWSPILRQWRSVVNVKKD